MTVQAADLESVLGLCAAQDVSSANAALALP